MKKLLQVRTPTLWLIAVLTAGLAYVSYLALRFETIRLGYEVDRARSEHDKLSAQHRLVALEVESLRARPRVHTIAERSLGMGAPDVARVVVVDGRGSARERWVDGRGSSAREQWGDGASTSRALGARRAR